MATHKQEAWISCQGKKASQRQQVYGAEQELGWAAESRDGNVPAGGEVCGTSPLAKSKAALSRRKK